MKNIKKIFNVFVLAACLILGTVQAEAMETIHNAYWVEINETSITLKPGETRQLKFTIIGENTNGESINWTSEDDSIVTVDDKGMVTAVGEGCCYVSARTDAYGSSVYICVKEPEAEVKYSSYSYRYYRFSWECEGKYFEDCYSCCRRNGQVSGSEGTGESLKAIRIAVEDRSSDVDVDLGIRYTTHMQGYGWLPWSADGTINGFAEPETRMEAIMIELTGGDAKYFDICYRVHVQSYGWLDWAKNGEPTGTVGYGKRLEAIQIILVKKGEKAPSYLEGVVSANDKAYIAKPGTSPVVNGLPTDNMNPKVPVESNYSVLYQTHVQSYGWQKWKYNGAVSGTTGEAKRLEGICIETTFDNEWYGDIIYTTHVQTYGWQDDLNDKSTWARDGWISGTTGEAKRLEAICIDLTGQLAEKFDVYYRVHAQTYGWLGWAKNGEPSGTAGYAKRLEGIQIVLVEKGGPAPASNYGGVTSNRAESYISK